MLRVFLNSAPDGVKKGLGLNQVLAKEGFEFFSSNGNVNIFFYLLLVLLPAKQGGILEENGGK